MIKKSIFSKTAAVLAGCLLLAAPVTAFADDTDSVGTIEPTVAVSSEEASSAADDTEENVPYTILLVGSDRRSDGWYGNSDAILLVTIRHDTKQLLVTSIMRDTFVPVPGRGTRKINSAYAAGGAQLLKDTIEPYFGVTINNYVAVDWASASKVVDLLGGVDIELRPEEVDSVNSLTGDVCRAIGDDQSKYAPVGSGLQHLSGPQAVAYSRIRYIGNNDFERTERQRKIINSLLGSLTLDSAASALSSMNEVLDLVENDLTAFDIAALAAQYLIVKDYEIVMDRIPYDGMYTIEHENLVPEQPATNDRLQAALYG